MHLVGLLLSQGIAIKWKSTGKIPAHLHILGTVMPDSESAV